MTDDREDFEQTALANDDEGGEDELHEWCHECGRSFDEPRVSRYCSGCLDEHIAAEDE